MSWPERHRESERLAAEAEAAGRAGDMRLAKSLYAQAADAEEGALMALDRTKARTLGISAVSTVSLRYKAEQYQLAEVTAYNWLASGNLPDFAVGQLKDLLETVWIESARDQSWCAVRTRPGDRVREGRRDCSGRRTSRPHR